MKSLWVGGWVQIVQDSGFLNSIAAYKHGVIRDWPSSSRAEAAAIYAALSASPANSVVKIYTDSQTAIDDLKRCSSLAYSNSRLYYKTTNFEFILISRLDLAAVHDFVLNYDNIVCEVNPRQLFKQYHQMLYMKDLLELSRFRFLFLLSDPSSYANASLHHTMKFQLFGRFTYSRISQATKTRFIYRYLLVALVKISLKILCTCLCAKSDVFKLQQILTSYLRHLISKITEAATGLAYSLVRGCLPSAFLDVFMELDIPRLSAMNVIAAIHNNFISKFRKWIWNPRSYDKGKWEHVMNITSKLKNSPRPKGLSKSSYLPYSSLPPPTHVFSRDSGTDWLKNSMQYGLTWF
ncbi:unnamed protein product [Rhizophagus irregularis]|nr:unnamed protein product [Rhizophagus irregularis]